MKGSHPTDTWFAQMLKPLSGAPGAHPSRAVLHAYMKGRLPDLWRLPNQYQRKTPDDWTLTEVSQHALVCALCQAQLAQMRRVELECSRIPAWAEMTARIPNALSLHLKVFAAAAVLLFAINWAILVLSPLPVSAGPCIPDVTNGAVGANPTVEPRIKHGEVNKPTGPACPPAPAPQPWQTWWAPWIFLFWPPFLVGHALWGWLTEFGLGRRRRATGTAFSGLASAGTRGLLRNVFVRPLNSSASENLAKRLEICCTETFRYAPLLR